MRKVELRMNEMRKYEIIKKLVETNGNKKRAATKLNCTIRTINRLIKKYKDLGKEGFIHGNRNRIPSTAIPLDVRNKIVALYINEYTNANYTHFCELVEEDLGYKISPTTLTKWLYDEDLISPKAHRKTKKKLKKELNNRLKENNSKKIQNEIKMKIESIDESNAHPRRPRSKYKGEMIQMDASSYEWIENNIWHLHVAIDDASGELVGAYFDYQETLNGYYNVLSSILTNYGIPAMFYTDRRTVFEYKRKNNAMDDDDTFTQFSYACHQFGIEIKTTSIAQAKGRVERVNQTLQSRLPIELKRARVTTIEQANKFLKSYLKKFNKQFALYLNDSKSVYEKQPSKDEINKTLAIISQRKVDHGHCIKYKKNYYIPIKADRTPVYFNAKSEALVIESFDKTLYVNISDQLFALKKIDDHEEYSKTFDITPKEEKKEKKLYIPPMTHPWKRQSYLAYLEKQKHRENRC